MNSTVYFGVLFNPHNENYSILKEKVTDNEYRSIA